MADPRMSPAPRGSDDRISTERLRKWQPPQTLPVPNPEPGFTFRWVRVSSLGQNDPTNISGKLREGYEPVKASQHPEIQLYGTGTDRMPDSIEVGGLVLCKIPTEIITQREQYYQQQSSGQMAAVDNNMMRENDPRMPLFKERRSETSFGRGS